MVGDPNFFAWVKRRTLVALFASPAFRDRLVLKGGSLLDLGFGISTRASLDLDFSIAGDFDDGFNLRAECEAVLRTAFDTLGYRVVDVTCLEVPTKVSPDLKAFWGGYRLGFKLIARTQIPADAGSAVQLRRRAAPLLPGGSTIFQIDISKHEFCEDKQDFELDGARVFGYSPELAIAEKLRAICQQMPEYRNLVKKHRAGRARDFVDIHDIREAYLVNFERPAFRDLVAGVFAAKRVPRMLLAQISNHRDDHRADFSAVQATVAAGAELEAFDFYVDYVVRACRGLEPLGDV